MQINNLLGQYGGSAASNLTSRGYDQANKTFQALCREQEDAMELNEPLCAIPLAWVALAAAVGLTVDRDGRIVDGPHQLPPGQPQRRDVRHRQPREVAD